MPMPTGAAQVLEPQAAQASAMGFDAAAEDSDPEVIIAAHLLADIYHELPIVVPDCFSQFSDFLNREARDNTPSLSTTSSSYSLA